MADSHNRIRIVDGDRELEIEGSDDFIATYEDTVAVMLQALRSEPAPKANEGSGRTPKVNAPPGGVMDGEFGEVVGNLPKSATATDQMLLAGRFAQTANEDNAFATKDASELLIEQSVKIGNPSQCMTYNLNAKRVFKIGGRYRVSKAGEEHLASLLAQ